jgi:hypothetical protein
MVALQRAVDAGFSNPAAIRNDPYLKTLRSRSDFQTLLMDLAFPSEPFCR